MPDDPQMILAGLASAFLVPALLGRFLGSRLSRGAAALWVGLLMGVPAALVAGPALGLLAAAWSLALGYLGASRGFVPSSLEDVASHARNNRRWWDRSGG